NPGTMYETSLPSTSLIRHLARHIAQKGGAALIIDYGFVEPSGKPTLQAVSKHMFTDILAKPGEVDITAHVDFGILKTVAEGQNVKIAGPIGQGEFLNNLGIELRATQLKQHAKPEQAAEIDVALKRLTSNEQMGSLFKAMALVNQKLGELPGF
ncbi:MAG TPA: SAM-dependent methyltransferase, partial [Alphaproteobacteria bacterium]|nr:SAM-dependent methyltransferase [Alphaproteobacteria bacterium]